jgi:hypothetical protein
MARTKYLDAYCNFCGDTTKMEIGAEAGPDFEGEKIWATCKKCKQTMLIDLQTVKKDTKPKVADIETSDCATYSPLREYQIGEAIYHKEWDDFGVVLKKEVLTNGKSSILVEFQNSGQKQLLETINQ